MVEKTALALVKRDVVDVVTDRVRQMTTGGELHLPADYSAENAMKSAWLVLQETVDRNKNPALTVCTPDSIANALLNMVVQGLTPAKTQGYFIVYGKSLVFQRSYFGSMALVRRILPGVEIYYEVVWKGDTLTYTIVRGRKVIDKHEQKIENVGGEIKAAYCVIEEPGNHPHTVLMSMGEIEKSWAQSKQYKAGSPHDTFAGEMALRTVVNRACKKVINSSSDAHLLAAMEASEEMIVEAVVGEEVDDLANGAVIEVDPPESDNVESDNVEEADDAEPSEAEPEAEAVAAAGGSKAPY